MYIHFTLENIYGQYPTGLYRKLWKTMGNPEYPYRKRQRLRKTMENCIVPVLMIRFRKIALNIYGATIVLINQSYSCFHLHFDT